MQLPTPPPDAVSSGSSAVPERRPALSFRGVLRLRIFHLGGEEARTIVDGCGILHHQKDGWKPKKIVGHSGTISQLMISQPSKGRSSTRNTEEMTRLFWSGRIRTSLICIFPYVFTKLSDTGSDKGMSDRWFRPSWTRWTLVSWNIMKLPTSMRSLSSPTSTVSAPMVSAGGIPLRETMFQSTRSGHRTGELLWTLPHLVVANA